METFTASNGLPVRRTRTGTLSFTRSGDLDLGALTGISIHQEAALREFFLHVRDTELGRWRWPEKPNFVGYHVEAERGVVIFDEARHMVQFYSENDPGMDAYKGDMADAARAYFAAHPVPKPAWQDAKPGEVWELTYGGCPTAHVFTNQHSKHPGFAFVADRAIVNPDDPDITSGRRIWPEVE